MKYVKQIQRKSEIRQEKDNTGRIKNSRMKGRHKGSA